MKLPKILWNCILVLIAAGVFLSPAQPVDALEYPATEAASSVLVDMDTGRVLYASNEGERAYPASTTKIMTALLVLESYARGDIELADTVTVSASASSDLTADSSTAGLLPGEVMSVDDLLYCALMVSANEACNVLAEYVSGSVESFLDLMNNRAIELGCADTHFANTHGLPNENHYTTAGDLKIISAEALKHDKFVEIVNSLEKTIPATNKSEARELKSTNRLIDPASEFYYEKASGVKTGFTKAAGQCLVSTATGDNGLRVMAVVMGVARADEKGVQPETEATSFSVSRDLYNWVFENYEYYEVLGTGETVASVPVIMGENADSVSVKPETPLNILLPNDYAESDITRDVIIFEGENDGDIAAPIVADQILGQVALTYNGENYGPVNLLANSAVQLSRVEYMKSEIIKTLSNIWVRVALIMVVLLFVIYFIFVVYNKIEKRRRKKRRRR